tara:strand:- start:2113 stop:2409 length:297 start_codon:yes stop_codon:yes gene_type:complete
MTGAAETLRGIAAAIPLDGERDCSPPHLRLSFKRLLLDCSEVLSRVEANDSKGGDASEKDWINKVVSDRCVSETVLGILRDAHKALDCTIGTLEEAEE